MGTLRRTAAQRRELVQRLMAEREATGESWRSVSARTGINYATLTGWAWRLRRERRASLAPRPERVEFVELLPRDAPESARELERDVPIEIVLRGERRLRIGAHFDADALTRLVRALEAC